MYGIVFELNQSEEVDPNELEDCFFRYGFQKYSDTLYITDNEDMSNLFSAIYFLKSLSWFSLCVRDIRTFRIEQWSDFTPLIKS